MKNKKGNNKIDIFKKVLLGIFGCFLCGGLVKLLVPGMYLMFMNLFGISANLLSGVVIGGSILGIVGLIGVATKCVEVKTEHVYNDGIETELELMRQRLMVVKSNDKCDVKEVKSTNKYSYVYDNNYMDVEDMEIDDITNPNWRSDYGFVDVNEYEDRDVKIYTRKNR